MTAHDTRMGRNTRPQWHLDFVAVSDLRMVCWNDRVGVKPELLPRQIKLGMSLRTVDLRGDPKPMRPGGLGRPTIEQQAERVETMQVVPAKPIMWEPRLEEQIECRGCGAWRYTDHLWVHDRTLVSGGFVLGDCHLTLCFFCCIRLRNDTVDVRELHGG